MRPLSQEYVDNCPREGEFRLRGMEMTRIEVFVDAAFAFALLGAWFPLVRFRRHKARPAKNYAPLT